MSSSHTSRRLRSRWWFWIIVLLIVWLGIAYWLLPDWWKGHEARRHPALQSAPRVTVTAVGIPGDPLNLFLIGSEQQITKAMLAAGWHPADPITLATSLRIAESSVFHRSYEDAPVSNLFLFGRREDLAFEKPVGNDPRQRHHVRFWQTAEKDEQGSPGWWGAVTYDRSVGFSHTTGQITHHIAPEIDAERDGLIGDLKKAGKVSSSELQDGFQSSEGSNGGGDRWQSDSKLGIVQLGD